MGKIIIDGTEMKEGIYSSRYWDLIDGEFPSEMQWKIMLRDTLAPILKIDTESPYNLLYLVSKLNAITRGGLWTVTSSELALRSGNIPDVKDGLEILREAILSDVDREIDNLVEGQVLRPLDHNELVWYGLSGRYYEITLTVYGDYNNTGPEQRSNYEALLRDYPSQVLSLNGMIYAKGLAVSHGALQGTPDLLEALTELKDYPIYDDNHWCNLRQSLEQEWFETSLTDPLVISAFENNAIDLTIENLQSAVEILEEKGEAEFVFESPDSAYLHITSKKTWEEVISDYASTINN